MSDRRDPIDRVVDLAIAVPTATIIAAWRAVPIAARAGTAGAAKAVGRLSEAVAAARAGDAELPTSEAVEREQPDAIEREPVVEESEPADDLPEGPADDETTSLPIEGYDDLAARQVVARLESLDEDDLAVIEHYERAHRNRSTVLGKIASLTG